MTPSRDRCSQTLFDYDTSVEEFRRAAARLRTAVANDNFRLAAMTADILHRNYQRVHEQLLSQYEARWTHQCCNEEYCRSEAVR
jgi:hypothetical protein